MTVTTKQSSSSLSNPSFFSFLSFSFPTFTTTSVEQEKTNENAMIKVETAVIATNTNTNNNNNKTFHENHNYLPSINDSYRNSTQQYIATDEEKVEDEDDVDDIPIGISVKQVLAKENNNNTDRVVEQLFDSLLLCGKDLASVSSSSSLSSSLSSSTTTPPTTTNVPVIKGILKKTNLVDKNCVSTTTSSTFVNTIHHNEKIVINTTPIREQHNKNNNGRTRRFPNRKDYIYNPADSDEDEEKIDDDEEEYNNKRFFDFERQQDDDINRTRTKSTGYPNNNNNNNNTKRTVVRFHMVDVQEFGLTLGHHPSAVIGPPTMLDYTTKAPISHVSMSLDEYENIRQRRRRTNRKELRYSLDDKKSILLNECGFTVAEINKAWADATMIRQQRKETYERSSSSSGSNTIYTTVDGIVETVSRKCQRITDVTCKGFPI